MVETTRRQPIARNNNDRLGNEMLSDRLLNVKSKAEELQINLKIVNFFTKLDMRMMFALVLMERSEVVTNLSSNTHLFPRE